MYNIDLNLLPPRKKKRIKNLIKFIYSKEILQTTILICSLTATVLVWNWIVLQEGFYELTLNSITANPQQFAYNQEIKKINKITKDIGIAGKSYMPISPKLLEITHSVPDSIKINLINLDRKKQTLTLSGTAKTRNDLISYENSFKNISWIEKVEAPISKLFQKDNINFEFKTKLKNFPVLK